jgi:hypothetical protein
MIFFHCCGAGAGAEAGGAVISHKMFLKIHQFSTLKMTKTLNFK